MASIFVRAFEPDDYKLINKWRNDTEIQKFTGGTFRYVSTEMEKQWVQQKIMNNYNEIYWAICLNDETKKMVGYTSFNNIDYIHRTIEGGGIVIGDKEANDGIILFEVMLIKLDYAFNTLNMNRITGKSLNSHPISPKFMEALKYKYEGTLRQSIFKNGKYNDQLLYSLLRDEYYQNLNAGDYEIREIIKRFRDITLKTRNSN
jgi:RimJ/RimL family protein N-acetyltransferase